MKVLTPHSFIVLVLHGESLTPNTLTPLQGSVTGAIGAALKKLPRTSRQPVRFFFAALPPP